MQNANLVFCICFKLWAKVRLYIRLAYLDKDARSYGLAVYRTSFGITLTRQ